MAQINDTNKENIDNFLYNITLLRRMFGYSKKKMAYILGISIGTLTKLESGVIPPRLSAEIFIRIYSAFGIKPSTLLSKRISNESNNQKSAETP